MDDVCPAHAVVFTVEKKEKSAGRKVISLPRRRPHVRQNADVRDRRGHGGKVPLPSDFSAPTLSPHDAFTRPSPPPVTCDNSQPFAGISVDVWARI